MKANLRVRLTWLGVWAALSTAGCGSFGDSDPSTVSEPLAGVLAHSSAQKLRLSANALGWSQQTEILAGDGAQDDYFGGAAAIDGDTAVVGASGDDDKGIDAGSVYVFVRSNGVWTLQAKLLASDGAAGDSFGVGVAIDGNTLVVGANGDDDKGSFSGAAYVFVRNGAAWTEQAKLVLSDGQQFDFVGSSIGLAGNTAVLGAQNQLNNGVATGAAYVFTRSGGVWTEQAKLVASDGAMYDGFGHSVAIAGNTVVVGANVDDEAAFDSGSAYAFTRTNGVWTQQAKLTASDGAKEDWFGHAVAVSGDTAVVGAFFDDDLGTTSGSAYVFVRNNGAWTQQAKLFASGGGPGEAFGYEVKIQGDTAAIAAIDDSDKGFSAGAVHMFERNNGVWTHQSKLVASDGAADDELGLSLGISGDTLVAGSRAHDHNGSNAGAVYIFKADTVGGPCAAGADCVTGFCVDGVCCSSACGGDDAGDCQACSVAAGAAQDGTCAVLSAGSMCRASAGACDPAEVCTGAAGDCPADALSPASEVCRGAAGPCDVSEMCTGGFAACPADTFATAGIECRASAGLCDPAELCTGAAADCPVDALATAGAECRAAAGACDIAESCDGVAIDCPVDALAAAGTECRAAAGACDVAESCDGAAIDCPADAFAADGAVCPEGLCVGGICKEADTGSSSSSSASGSSASGTGGSPETPSPEDGGGCACELSGKPLPSQAPAAASVGLLALLGAAAGRRRRRSTARRDAVRVSSCY